MPQRAQTFRPSQGTDAQGVQIPQSADAKVAQKLHSDQCLQNSQEPQLREDPDGLSLVGDGMVLRADFSKMMKRVKGGKLPHEMLVKATKIKGVEGPLLAIDATAGLGEDSFLLAAAGFEVHLFEFNPTIAALLQDGLNRAKQDQDSAEIAERMHLHQGDSVTGIPELVESLESDRGIRPDVILLDPMFPAKQKNAVSKKKLQMIQHLEKPCDDEEALLDVAIQAKPRKVVVKRPLKGPFLAGKKPSYSLKGKTIRYDVFVLVPHDS